MDNVDNDKSLDEKLNSKRPSRFAWGIALGVGIGAIAVTIALALTAFIIYSNWVGRFMPRDSRKIEVVKSNKQWIKMTDKTHGRITGVSGESGSRGTGKAYGAIGEFELEKPTQQSGVLARISVSIFLTPKTKMTIGGKPWKPQFKTGKTPAETAFGMGGEDIGEQFFDMQDITVYFRREGHDLVAERIDGTKKKQNSQY